MSISYGEIIDPVPYPTRRPPSSLIRMRPTTRADFTPESRYRVPTKSAVLMMASRSYSGGVEFGTGARSKALASSCTGGSVGVVSGSSSPAL